MLRKLRTERGLSQEQLAHLVGKTASAATKWEAGETTPRRGTATALDDALDAGGQILVAFGYQAGEVTPLDAQVAELQALVRDLAVQVAELTARVDLKDASDEQTAPRSGRGEI